MGDFVPDHEFEPNFVDHDEAIFWLERLETETPWRDDDITLFGKTFPIPRRTALYGDPGTSYTYSRIHMEPLAWTPLLIEIKQRVEALADHRFNAVLVNLYRNGQDSNGWHADNEKELGTQPVIASVSLGASRTMRFKERTGTSRYSIELTSGSLLVMRGDAQSRWLHCIPKQTRVTTSRINLTFREILGTRSRG